MIRKIATIALLVAACGPALAQDENLPAWGKPRADAAAKAISTEEIMAVTAADAESVKACLAGVLARPVDVDAMEGGYSVMLPGVGRGFARSIVCADGKATFGDAVMVNDVIRTDQVAGSALKADRLTVWTPVARAGCAVPVDYGVEMVNFRWFNWDERVTDGGNKRLEIIRNSEGKEVRISTISHFRAGEVLWSPKPDEAASECAPSGGYQISKLDVRWSTRGTAYGLIADALLGKGSLPLTPQDARSASAPYGITGVLTGSTLRDITETSILRSNKVEFDLQAAPESAVPWAFLISKYAKELIFRQNDDSLLRRVLPLDLSNTLHFTKGTLRVSMPESSGQTAALLPFSTALDLSSVNLSSTLISADTAISLNGSEPGELRVTATIGGVGSINGVASFRTQMFGKNIIAAAAEGGVDLNGKTGPGLTGLSLRFRDEGLTPAFTSLFKSSPSSFLVRTARSDIEFWRDVSLWLRGVEAGREPALTVRFASPQVMMDGFWTNAFKGATATVGE